MNCNENYLGVINTFCTIVFETNHEVEIQSQLIIAFTGMLISTDTCEMVRADTSTNVLLSSCASNTDQNQLTVTLNNEARLPGSVKYTLTIYGVSILSNVINHYIDFSVRDPSGSYIIEKSFRILLTSVATPQPI